MRHLSRVIKKSVRNINTSVAQRRGFGEDTSLRVLSIQMVFQATGKNKKTILCVDLSILPNNLLTPKGRSYVCLTVCFPLNLSTEPSNLGQDLIIM